MILPEGLQSILKTVSAIADWFLIIAGALMMVLGWFRIDVALAKYLLVACGAFLLLAGCWFRFRSIRRQKTEDRGQKAE